MNISLDPINLSGFISGSTRNFFGQLKNHVVKNLENLSYYIRYNQLTLAASVLGVNLALISLTDKLINVVSPKFIDLSQESRVRQSVKWLLKSACVLGGVLAFNRLMNLNLSRLYLAASVVSTIALQVLWQRIVAPALKDYCAKRALKKQVEEERKRDLLKSKELEDSSLKDETGEVRDQTGSNPPENSDLNPESKELKDSAFKDETREVRDQTGSNPPKVSEVKPEFNELEDLVLKYKKQETERAEGDSLENDDKLPLGALDSLFLTSKVAELNKIAPGSTK